MIIYYCRNWDIHAKSAIISLEALQVNIALSNDTKVKIKNYIWNMENIFGQPKLYLTVWNQNIDIPEAFLHTTKMIESCF